MSGLDLSRAPLGWWEINTALVGGGIVRGVVVGAGVLAVALPLTGSGAPARPFVLLLGTLGVLLVAAQVGVIAGGHAKSLDHVYSMESIILLPLGCLGGVFYSVHQLPPLWDFLSPAVSAVAASSVPIFRALAPVLAAPFLRMCSPWAVTVRVGPQESAAVGRRPSRISTTFQRVGAGTPHQDRGALVDEPRSLGRCAGESATSRSRLP